MIPLLLFIAVCLFILVTRRVLNHYEVMVLLLLAGILCSLMVLVEEQPEVPRTEVYVACDNTNCTFTDNLEELQDG